VIGCSAALQAQDPSPGPAMRDHPLAWERAFFLRLFALSRGADLYPYLLLDTGGEKVQGGVLNPEGV
jgi:hypothetical protein